MHYIFTGFRDSNAVRHFNFDRVAEDRSRTKVVVDADMASAREHKILLQDLPLLCLRLLETSDEAAHCESFTFTQARMLEIRNAAKAAGERKTAKKPQKPSPAAGQAWRTGWSQPAPAGTAAPALSGLPQLVAE